MSMMVVAMSGCSADAAPNGAALASDGAVPDGGESDGSSTGDLEGAATNDAPFTTCADGIKNGDESDVDCGGFCSPCQLNKACRAHSDCASYHCVDTQCQVCAPNTNQCSGNKPSTCVNGMWVVANDDCPTMCDLNTGTCVVGSE